MVKKLLKFNCVSELEKMDPRISSVADKLGADQAELNSLMKEE